MADVLAVLGGGSLLIGLCVLACPLMMGAMLWGMRRGPGASQHAPDAPAADPTEQAELARLRFEIGQLKAAQADTTEGGPPSVSQVDSIGRSAPAASFLEHQRQAGGAPPGW